MIRETAIFCFAFYIFKFSLAHLAKAVACSAKGFLSPGLPNRLDLQWHFANLFHLYPAETIFPHTVDVQVGNNISVLLQLEKSMYSGVLRFLSASLEVAKLLKESRATSLLRTLTPIFSTTADNKIHLAIPSLVVSIGCPMNFGIFDRGE